jgi:hypothetical protein
LCEFFHAFRVIVCSSPSREHDVAFTHVEFPVGYFLPSLPNFAHFQTKTFQNLNVCTKYTKKVLNWGKFPAYNSPSVERFPYRTMKLHVIRSVSALGLAALLAACGGGQIDQSSQAAAVAGQSGSAAKVIAAAMPTADCAADGCKSLRIIDANAEAYRYDAMRRAAADEAAGVSNS